MKDRNKSGREFRFGAGFFGTKKFRAAEDVRKKKSMADDAMGFQYPMLLLPALQILLTAVLLSGCGAKAYESVGYAEEAGECSESVLSENESGAQNDSLSTGKDSTDGAAEGTGSSDQTKDGEYEISETVRVYVCGAVKCSGVYELPADARIAEAVLAAGGLTDDADETQINQAAYVSDGMQITVPVKGSGESVKPVIELTENNTESPAEEGAESSPKVNINTAGAEELTTLNGIGESRAADIIAYREEHGPFSAIEDIMKVSGIKNALFEKIRDHITV